MWYKSHTFAVKHDHLSYLDQFKRILAPIKDLKLFLAKTIQPITTPASNLWHRIWAPWDNAWHNYAQRHPRESKIISWITKVTKWIFSSVFLFIILTYLGVFGHIPTQEELKNLENANASEVYTSDGLLIGKYYTENRTNIKLDSISPYVITALLAVEDKRFFEHNGIDFRALMRVFKGVATQNAQMGGGSTLSQQLAKNLFPRKNFKIPGLSLFINKIRENIISIRLEGIYNKEELLTKYLNTVPFGGNRYGIQVASKYFYNKRPKNLTPDEAATLIGMLKATTWYDPTRNPNNAKERRDIVLAQMHKNKDFRFDSEDMTIISEKINSGAITDEGFKNLIEKPIHAKQYPDIGNNEGMGTYFREYLRTKELPRLLKDVLKEDGTPYNFYTDGLKIRITLDSKMQKAAEEAVSKHMSKLQASFVQHWRGIKNQKPWGDDKWINEQLKKSDRYNGYTSIGLDSISIDSLFNVPVKMKLLLWDKNKTTEVDTLFTPLDSVRYYFTMLNCGFMAIEHKSGHIKAWVGGTDFKYFKYDHILSKRQVGSTFKPIVYTAAMMNGMTPCTFLQNKEVNIKDWAPGNSDGAYGGWYSVVGGLTYSTNVIAAQLIEKVGIQKTIDLATAMGITSTLPREYGISLGAVEISLYEMMRAYATIANEGIRPEMVGVLSISNRHGDIIYSVDNTSGKPLTEQSQYRAIPDTIAHIVKRMMQYVVTYGTANNLRSQYVPHGEFGGKTGTTQNHSDGWFIAFNNQLVTGAWVGGPSPVVRFNSMALGSGAAMALPLVGEFWYGLVKDPKYNALTQEKLTYPEEIKSKFDCPLRMYDITPDTLRIIMQDSTARDSLLKNGFKDLIKYKHLLFPPDSISEPDNLHLIEGQNNNQQDEENLEGEEDTEENNI